MLCRLKWRTVKPEPTNTRRDTASLQTSSGSWTLRVLHLYEIKIFLHIRNVNFPSPNCFLTPDGDKVSTTCSNFRPAASQETLWWKQRHTRQLGAHLCLKRVRPSAGGPQLEPLSPKASAPAPAEGPLCKALNSYQLLWASLQNPESNPDFWPTINKDLWLKRVMKYLKLQHSRVRARVLVNEA